jgi:signal transduction histidine kinase
MVEVAMQRKRPLALVAVSIVAALLLVAALGLSIFTSRRLASSSARVDHTMLVKVAVAQLLGTLFEAEAGQRGYVLTGRPEYLEPYGRARFAVREQLDRLRLLITHNEAAKVVVQDIARLTTVKLDELERVIDRRDREGLVAAQASIDTDLGLRTMDAIESKLDELTALADTRLAARLEQQQHYESLTRASLVVTSVLFGLFAGLVVFWHRTAEARRRSAQFQERFMAILGHDLRSPLSSMSMGLSLLRRHPPSEQRVTLDRMASTAARMSRMIDQLLDLTRSRLGAGIPVIPVPTDLGKVVTDVANEARAAHPERTLLVDMTGDLEGEWDPDRLAQVASNLVGNAMVHGAPEIPVRVTVRSEPGAVEVAVHNGGPAIPEVLRGVLFDPFRRGHEDGETSRTSGLGLGLYITREIVVGHGGTVDVVSTDAEGSTFRVVLPRRSARSRRAVSGFGPTRRS